MAFLTSFEQDHKVIMITIIGSLDDPVRQDLSQSYGQTSHED